MGGATPAVMQVRGCWKGVRGWGGLEGGAEGGKMLHGHVRRSV